MSNKENIKRELEELDSPILAKWQGKSEHWQMPENYLSDLTEQVIQQPSNDGFKRLLFLQIAAAILFVLAGTWLVLSFQPNTETPPMANLDDISTEDIQNYVLDNIGEFDIELLEDFALELEPSFDENDNAIEEYLLEESGVGLF